MYCARFLQTHHHLLNAGPRGSLKLRQQQALIRESECDSVEILDIGGENMKNERTIGCATFAIVIAFIFVAQPVAARLVTGATGYGSTLVTTYTCDAEVYGAVPAVLDIDSGDDVIFYYYVSWADQRIYPSQAATHNFTMIVSYSKLSGDRYDWLEFSTDGNTNGGTMRSITVYNVQPPAWISVYWIATITSTSPSCSDQDSEGGPIQIT